MRKDISVALYMSDSGFFLLEWGVFTIATLTGPVCTVIKSFGLTACCSIIEANSHVYVSTTQKEVKGKKRVGFK